MSRQSGPHLGTEVAAGDHLDPARWVTLAISILAAFIVVLDNTVLNVAIPTILRDFHTTLPSIEWVVTGYALTFATLLIIGGRLGDVYGHRKIFVIGLVLFGVGSLLAALSQNVMQLVLGEAIIEGIGASLMLPATLAILSSTFKGRERATAFAAWGATAGVAAASGPVVGGFLTTNYSWRWAFGINVIVAPLAIIGALWFMPAGVRSGRKMTIDITGALLVAIGMFSLVFALSEGGIYGWFSPIKSFTVAGSQVWPSSWPSVIPFILLLSPIALGTFYFVEKAKVRQGKDPLFVFSDLRYKTYRYGLLTGVVVSMGQLGLSFALPLFLQDGRHLTAAVNGLWLLPSGLFVIVGAQVGGRLSHRFGTVNVVRLGLASYALGILLIVSAISLSVTWYELLPGLALYGVGIGFALAQLTNVILSEIPAESSGVASGANTAVRQVGSALGVAVIGAVLTAQTASRGNALVRAADVPAGLKRQALAGIRALGANWQPATSVPAHDAQLLRHALEQAVTTGTRFALVFAIVVVATGALLSFLIPNRVDSAAALQTDGFEPLEPMDVDPELVRPTSAGTPAPTIH
ncbi:MAG: family efflux transporter permease subunit [Actinomycetia bacterium]|nr:family efflux transporter permease subunit [Actinomycetes bacterium]